MKNKRMAVLLAMTVTALSLGAFAACGGGDDGPITTGELVKDENGNVVFENVEIVCNTVVSGSDKDAFEQTSSNSTSSTAARSPFTRNPSVTALLKTPFRKRSTTIPMRPISSWRTRRC